MFLLTLESLLTRYSKTSVLADMVNGLYQGQTPLHIAAEEGDLDTVKILIEAGADVDILDEWNQNAIQLTKNPQIIALLVAAGSKTGWLDVGSLKWIMSAHHPVTIDCLKNFRKRMGHHWIESSRNLSSLLDPPIDDISSEFLTLLFQHGGKSDWAGRGERRLIHMALCHSELTSYLLALRQIMDCEPFPWHTIPCYEFNEIQWISGHWRFFRRRIPFKEFQRMMNLHPDQGMSPLCQAAAIDGLDIIDHCLEMGADIDFEGSSYGSALSMSLIFFSDLNLGHLF